MTRPLVIQAEDLDPAAAAWLRESCDLEVCPFTDEARFGGLLSRADGVVVRTYARIDSAFLDKAPRLKCVARAGVGLDRIDVDECRRRGIEVVHTPDANTVAVAEYVFAVLLDTVRPRVCIDTPLSLDRWNVLRRDLEAPAQLSELTLGILGLGRVGSRVARLGAGLGMKVLYNDLVEIPPQSRYGAVPAALPDMLRRSDILTIHIDNRPTNRKFVNAAILSQLRRSAIVVNTSRGLIIDEHALAAFLRANSGARALIDVHDPEPFGANYPLLGLPNASLSPHIAACTRAAQVAMSWVVKDLVRVLRGEKPDHPAP